MLRAAIVEPKKEKREYIKAAVEALHMDIRISDYSNKYDLLEHLDAEGSSFDILLLNTTLHHEGDGIELAGRIRAVNRKVMICFVTDSTRYYADAFSVFATGYLLYPFDIGELHNCINFYYQKSETDRRASWMVKEKGGNYRRIYCRYIRYVESANREILIHMEDGSVIESYAKLDKAVEELPDQLFLRCHQSYIINLYFVEEMERSCFHLQEDEIPISRKYQKLAKEAYYDYMFEKM